MTGRPGSGEGNRTALSAREFDRSEPLIALTWRPGAPLVTEAFDLLRRISQSSNVKLHLLAEQTVKVVASGNDGDKVTPISLDARRSL